MTEGNGDVRELPKGWVLVKLAEIAAIKGGLTKGKKRKEKDCLRQVPYLRVANVQRGFLDLQEVSLIEATENEIEGLRLLPGDILFNEGGDRDKLGRGWVWTGEIPECIHQNHVFRARLYDPRTQSKLISWYGNTFGQKYFIDEGKQTTNLASINLTKLSNFPIPLSPIAEQLRILEKLEELISELDQGVESLKTAQKQLKVYRQAVLKWAFEGKLTEVWRTQHQSTLKTGEALLAQIKAERENRYQQQLAEWETAVKEWEAIEKVGKKPTKPQKPKELSSLTEADLSELSQLPDSWVWIRIGSVTECLDSMRIPINKKEREKRHGDIPYYGANGRVGWIDDHLFDEPLVLVVEDETFTGREKPFSYKISGKSWVNNHAHILRSEKNLDINYLNYQLFYYPFTALTTGTTGRKKLTQDALTNAPIKFCSIEEQEQIVEEIESRLSICDQLEVTIIENLQKAEALRQSILKQAFEGKLVPQDPNDEPAEKLLERIKAERQATRSPKTSKQLKIKGL